VKKQRILSATLEGYQKGKRVRASDFLLDPERLQRERNGGGQGEKKRIGKQSPLEAAGFKGRRYQDISGSRNMGFKELRGKRRKLEIFRRQPAGLGSAG